MRLAGRIAAAIEVLENIETRHRPASTALKDWGQANRFAGSGDRAVIGNLVFDALRQRASMSWCMGDDKPRSILLGVVRWEWELGIDEIEEIFSGETHAPPTLTETERFSLDRGLSDDAPDWVCGDYPEWLRGEFSRAFADTAATEGAAMADRAPVDLRVNTLKQNREKVIKALARFNPEACTLSPVGIRIPAGQRVARAPALQADAAFGKGWFEVQDEGSQLTVRLAGIEPGMQIADICAGAGGKTLALSAMMNNKGQVHAYDADRHRLKAIWERLRRAGTRNVQVIEPGARALDDLSGRMDIVLVDAPCTGSGTWRRKPDAKWRLTDKTLNSRLKNQVEVLDMAVSLVKPGGRLVYVTCSVLPRENQDQIESFLLRHPDFSPAPLDADILRKIHERRGETASDLESNIQLTPLRDSTDGFFVAALGKLAV